MKKKAIVLINLGTPKSSSLTDVGYFLKEMLLDKNILPLPSLLRSLLVRGYIIPKRVHKVAKNYASIWMDEGSPLAVYSDRFMKKLSSKLPPDISLFMTYLYPKELFSQLDLSSFDEVLFFPLFPFQVTSFTRTLYERISSLTRLPKSSRIIHAFDMEPFFLETWNEYLCSFNPSSYDQVLFSFHALPKSELKYKDRCQSFVDRLKPSLPFAQVSFQSAMHHSWTKPSTHDLLQKASLEKKRVLVLTPSFVVDCLETLHELKNEYKHFSSLDIVPCFNDYEPWVERFSKFCIQSFS